jgi:hypothetical protein
MTATTLHLDPAYVGDAPVPGPPSEPLDETEGEGQWPPMLVLDEDTKDRLTKFLEHELEKCYTERQRLVEDWKRWQTDYWAKPASEEKNFPFKRSANFIIPLNAIAVEAAHSRFMNTLFSVRPFWSVRPKSRQWIESARPVEDWLQTEVENPKALNLFHFCTESLMELCKLGTAVGKSGYERVIKKTNIPTRDGLSEPRYVTVKNSATLDYVPVANFLMRINEQDPQEATWVGEDHRFTWAQLKRMSASGRLEPEAVNSIKHWWQSSVQTGDSEDYKDHVDKLAKIEEIWKEEFRTQEIWLSFDVDGDGYDEEIVLDYHHQSRTILSARYNWYEDLRRPYRLAQYIKVEGRWPGIGIGKQTEQFQKIVTTINRQRVDNATLANMRMFAIKSTSGYGPGEPIFPGKIWTLDDPADIQPVQMSEIYQSSVFNEDSLIRYQEKRVGVNEIILGLPQQGTPGTATGDLARIEEGNKRFSLVLKNIRHWLGLLGTDVLSNYQQFGDQNRHWLVLDERGEYVEKVLNMPARLASEGAIVEITVSDSTINRQVEQQQWIGLFQVLTNYYDRVLQLAQVLGDQELFAQIGQRAMLASDEAIKRLLETFTITDTERFMLTSEESPDVREASSQPGGPAGNGMAPRDALGPGAGGPAGAQEPAGMDGLFETLALLGEGVAQRGGFPEDVG